MKAPWSPDKDAKGADPNNPPKNNPPPDYNKPYKYEYTWGQMGGTDVVECEILQDHVDATYTIKFWDYNVNDWEIRRVKRDDVRGIYKPAPLGKVPWRIDLILRQVDGPVPTDRAVSWLFEVLIEKGILSEAEILAKFKEIQE